MYSLDAVESELLSALWDGLFEVSANAVQHVRFLLNIELVGTPMTLNHYFNDNIQNGCRDLLSLLIEVD